MHKDIITFLKNLWKLFQDFIYIYKLTLQGAHKTANHKITVEQAFEGK